MSRPENHSSLLPARSVITNRTPVCVWPGVQVQHLVEAVPGNDAATLRNVRQALCDLGQDDSTAARAPRTTSRTGDSVTLAFRLLTGRTVLLCCAGGERISDVIPRLKVSTVVVSSTCHGWPCLVALQATLDIPKHAPVGLVYRGTRLLEAQSVDDAELSAATTVFVIECS